MCAMSVDDVVNESLNNKQFRKRMNERVEVRLSGVNVGDRVKAKLTDGNRIHIWTPEAVGPERVKEKAVAGGAKVLYAVFVSKPTRRVTGSPQSYPTDDLTVEITNESTTPPTVVPASFVVAYV